MAIGGGSLFEGKPILLRVNFTLGAFRDSVSIVLHDRDEVPLELGDLAFELLLGVRRNPRFAWRCLGSVPPSFASRRHLFSVESLGNSRKPR